MNNTDWYDKVKLPGKGIRLYKESHREALWVALNIYSSDSAVDNYLNWTGYSPRTEWVAGNTPRVDQDTLEILVALIAVIDKCDLEIHDLLDRVSDAFGDDEWDFITDEA